MLHPSAAMLFNRPEPFLTNPRYHYNIILTKFNKDYNCDL